MKYDEIRDIEHNHNQFFLNNFENKFIKLHFVGDLICNSYYELRTHTNPGYEICLISHGKGFFKIKDKTYAIENSQLFITEPLQPHSGWPSRENPYRILYICFSLKAECSKDVIWGEISNRLSNIKAPVAYDKYGMNEIHKRILYETENKEQYSSEIISNLVMQFVLLTLRNFKVGVERVGSNPREEGIVSTSIVQFIDSKLEEEINLEKISEALKYSVQHLCRCFKEQTGFTIMEYYNYARLERAKKYLVETQKSITNISGELNYNSIHHFSNSFKALYRYSPTEYRKKNL